MTALDQAFIKAFTRQEPAASMLSPSSPEPPAAPKASVAKRKVVKTVGGKPAGEKPKGLAPKLVPVIAEVPQPAVPAAPSVSPASPGGSLPSLSSYLASSASAGDVWAALERPSKPAEASLRVKSEPAVAEPAEISAEVGAMPWSLGGEQWAVAVMQYPKEPELSPVKREAEAEATIVPEAEAEPEAEVEAMASETELEQETAEAASVPVVELSVLKPQVPPAASHREFKPAWQVNQFTWPRICRRLIAHAPEELDRLADALLAVHSQGQKVLAMGACRQGEGATTMLLCAARRLAERGIKSVLVDADLVQPQLAKQLGVQSQLGWNETSDKEGRTLDEAIVEAVANNAALLPATASAAIGETVASSLARLPGCLEVLREHYDMVLVDLGPLENIHAADVDEIDAVALVQNRHITSEGDLLATAQKLAAAKVNVVGIVENFVLED